MASETKELKPIYKGRGFFNAPITVKECLLKLISESGPVTRSELVKETKIPRSTIYDSLVKLILDGQVWKYSVPSKKRGRPRIFYETTELYEKSST